jgi:K+-sensing histidine kinase KdpD
LKTIDRALPGHLRIVGDQMLLEHVVCSLMSNAVKFRTTEPLKVNAAATENETRGVEISLADNGIEPKYAERVLEMFYRLHNDDEYEGVGIGLALSDKTITDHGGTVRVDKGFTEGTRFVITLVGTPAYAVACSRGRLIDHPHAGAPEMGIRRAGGTSNAGIPWYKSDQSPLTPAGGSRSDMM